MLAVTVKEVALGERAGKENATDTAPLLNALPVPTFVPVTPVGANGSKKSFDAWDFLPILLPDAMFNLLFLIKYLYYAVKSPKTTHVFAALLKRVADDQVVRSFKPGVALTVTPAPAAIVTCPAPV